MVAIKMRISLAKILSLSVVAGVLISGCGGSTGPTGAAGAAGGTGVAGAAGAAGTNGAAGPGITWVDVNTASVQAASNKGYVADAGATMVIITLPPTPAVGDLIQVTGAGTGGWSIAQNSGQSIAVQDIPGRAPGEKTTGAISGGQFDAIELQYIGSDTFTIVSFIGNLGDLSAPLTAGYVSEGALTWSPISGTGYTWADANTYCATSTDGYTDWRLPTELELIAFYNVYPTTSTVLSGLGWSNANGNNIWSSSPALAVGEYWMLDFNDGTANSTNEMNTPNVTCVR